MTLSRTQSVFTFQSVQGSQTWFFDVVVGIQSNITAENIRVSSSFGIQSGCTVPQAILDDIQEAIALVQDLVTETQVASGTVTFTGQTVQTGAIAGGTLNNTEYRVVYTPPDDILIRTENQTLTSFDAVTSTAYGTIPDPKDVDFIVLVSTFQASSVGGTLTFVQADAGQKAVAFVSALESDQYRVMLTPSDFFSARVINKTRTGFIVEIGVSLGAADTVDVGYDVFVG